ncbi:unnamed protein product [Linum trigynum]|uniref:Uncharacterized protein n=1 Tax=Linum trigynum TaxID=586398 RepID=A0AAV2FNJ0_9ROSI
MSNEDEAAKATARPRSTRHSTANVSSGEKLKAIAEEEVTVGRVVAIPTRLNGAGRGATGGTQVGGSGHGGRSVSAMGPEWGALALDQGAGLGRGPTKSTGAEHDISAGHHRGLSQSG